MDDVEVAVMFLMLVLGWVYLEDGEEDPLVEVLRQLDYNQAADLVDGTRRCGRIIPHERRWWHTTGRNLSSAQFRSAFRCRKTTFWELVEGLYGTTELRRGGDRGPLFDPCERTAVFMWRLGGDTTVRQTSLHFGLSEGAISQITLEVARLVDEILYPQCMEWPSPREQRVIAREWEAEKSLRGVIGAIDGSHIKILAPEENLQLAYYNYKHYYSISLLAIVDNKGLFRWICAGAPGSCGDNGVFKETDLYAKVQAEREKPPKRRRMFHDGACILGDSAFAESPWMRTPIGVPSTRAQRFFNHKHSSMRFRVEHSFGRLKRKFRGLWKGLDCRLEHCSILVIACVVLHNFIFTREGDSPAEMGADPGPTRNGTGHAASAGVGASDSARAREVEYLRRSFLVQEWGAPGSRADRARREDERRMRRNNGTSSV